MGVLDSADAPPLGFVRSIKRLGTTTTRLEPLRLDGGATPRMRPGARSGDGAAITKALIDNLRPPASR